MSGLNDKVILVTGGSRGIGASICLLSAAKGFRVAVNFASNADAAEGVVAAIRLRGGEAVAVRGDVGSEADIVAMFEQVDRTFGRLDALVNNAGIIDTYGRLDEIGSAERFERVFRINVGGTMLCAREAVKRMSTRHGGKGGAIVNMSSAAALHGAPGWYVDYAASKGAVDTFTIGLSREVATEGIRVNAIRPGIVETDIHDAGGSPGTALEAARNVPMKRAGTPDEIAHGVIWLLSPEASYVTGSIMSISGGR